MTVAWSSSADSLLGPAADTNSGRTGLPLTNAFDPKNACVESNDTDLNAIDPSSPAAIFYYLVRSENGCGGNLGTDSTGAPRSGVNCP